MQRRGRTSSVSRARGRPVGADSARTRKLIVRAAREVVNERGYSGMTFQAIAKRTELSRPTLHYYFATRDEVFEALLDEARDLIEHCAGRSLRSDTLLERLSAFVAAVGEVDARDPSIMPFLISARLEWGRNPELQSVTASPVQHFLMRLVSDAVRRDELAPDTDCDAVVDMLHVILYGMAFYAGYTGGGSELTTIAKQLIELFAHGLVTENPDGRRTGSAQPR
ncbi:TetR/AcrR family transcriptional regulator [Mycobacterium sp. PS03-16]|uniref:TetR/AcrR family transcriptional regulator n=1 Tax=Mycobacterium sp. PS03-16 TaxID=2559611 RepID=UPI00107396D5|nr:TetR/AcrR family transcriptional regulator [Mycobacterium sp. PS03-16]TFV60700.1 TetR/AcrR family transcriptional regulator [Mycobacterium sp. PS03-16]